MSPTSWAEVQSSLGHEGTKFQLEDRSQTLFNSIQWVGWDPVQCLWKLKDMQRKNKEVSRQEDHSKSFDLNDQVQLLNSFLKCFLRKLWLQWFGPFTINEVIPYSLLFDNRGETFVVNGKHLKHYLAEFGKERSKVIAFIDFLKTSSK